MCSHVQSCKLVHESGVHCHVHASSTSGCAFVYFTVRYCIEHSSTVSLFQAQNVSETEAYPAAKHREISSVLCDHLEGWDREDGREKQEGGDMGIYVYV